MKPVPGRIAYGTHSGPANSLAREVDLATGGNVPLLAPGVSSGAAWSPDGSRTELLPDAGDVTGIELATVKGYRQ